MQTERELFATRMIFLRCAWMIRYQGISADDKPSRGGSWISKHKYGHEIFNFQNFRGALYGCVQPSGARGETSERTIRIEKLGASLEDESISGVLVVWVSTHPKGGGRIVGWYDNATVFRKLQPARKGSKRKYAREKFGYFVTARSEDTKLLKCRERNFPIRQIKAGGFGESNVWFANQPTNPYHRQIRSEVLEYVATGKLSGEKFVVPLSAKAQADIRRRRKIEEHAIDLTSAHFSEMGYRLKSREREKVGWDLDAIGAKQTLRLEVKGLSAAQTGVELTPNEYKAMKIKRSSYHVCVVTSALSSSRRLEVFWYNALAKQWQTDAGRVLKIEERVAAHCTAD